jgi:hypothetical protein
LQQQLLLLLLLLLLVCHVTRSSRQQCHLVVECRLHPEFIQKFTTFAHAFFTVRFTVMIVLG